jgi:hypothetical protein
VAVKLKNAADSFLRGLAVLWYTAALLLPVYAQSPEPRSPAPGGGDEAPEVLGDAAAAEKYAVWARQAIEEGRWGEAEAALERAADYASVSSDLSYLLALARFHENRPRGTVLEAVRRSLEADRWRLYTPETARLLEAETLIAVRAFPEALRSLSSLPESAESFRFRLLVFKGLGNAVQFRTTMAQALDRYPRDTRLLRILFEFYRPSGYAYPESGRRGTLFQNDQPVAIEAVDRDLMALALKRLPLLTGDDPALAYVAAPFIRDTEEARRLMGAYRAGGGKAPEALPAALGLGLISGARAVDELFCRDNVDAPRSAGPVLDRALLESIWVLLRDKQGRDRFMRNLLGFSGVITEDRNRDGFPETRIRYQDGMILAYSHDAGQDGFAELEITFTAGTPDRGELTLLPEDNGRPFACVVSGGEQLKARVWWERYPAVLRTELGETAYIPRPLEFFLAPVRFVTLPGSEEPVPPQAEFSGSGGLLYPEGETFSGLSRRVLTSSALAIERPGGNFSGALERVELERSVPLRAREHLKGRIVSETEFFLGRPVVQHIDLDLDGRMETIRRFRQNIPSFDPEDAGANHTWDYGKIIASSESDWDGDGVFEYGEEHLPGGVIRSWDINRDGVKEYSETGKD